MQAHNASWFCAAALASFAVAQNPSTDESPSAVPFLAEGWRVPVHSQEADPEQGEYGIWAAGRGYKASFHDGMRFYPVLGADAPRNLPVSWRTTSVRVGEREVFDASAIDSARDTWRFEYRTPGVREVYDVQSNGLMQSFVIDRPTGFVPGRELVVAGLVTSELTPRLEPLANGEQSAICFYDANETVIVRYGEAIAFDANGRRTLVSTGLTDGHVTLTVPAPFVANAAWPITVDPLLTPQLLKLTAASGPIVSSDIELCRTNATRRAMTVFSIPTSASDIDVFAVLSDDLFGSAVTVYSDLSNSWSSNGPRVAFVDHAGPSGRWTLAFDRSSRGWSRVRVYLHDSDNTQINSGTLVYLSQTVPATNSQDRRPDIGGSAHGDEALVAYEADDVTLGTYVDNTRVYTASVNADTGTYSVHAPLEIVVSGQHDYEHPCVSQTEAGSPLYWVVCAQRRHLSFARWDIVAARREANGAASLPTRVVGPESGHPLHAIRPSVDGHNTRFCVSYLRTGSITGTTGSELWARRFHWYPSATSPILNWNTMLDSANTTLFQSLAHARVTADLRVGHWAVTYVQRNLLLSGDSVRAARIGYNGDVVDPQLVYSSLSLDGAAPAIAYDFTKERFNLAYGTDAANSPVWGRVWTYPTDATNTSYGSSCGGNFGAVSRPLVGTEFFRVRLQNAQPNALAMLAVNFAPASVDLSPFGAPGCRLLVDANGILTLPVVTDALGDGLTTIVGLTLPLDLYMQWLHLDPSANNLGFLWTEGMKSQVR